MRTALGARRGRLVRQLLTESLMLSFAGALLGLAIALWITLYLAHQGSIALPLLSSVGIDGAALAWTLFVAISAAVLFGLVPALKIAGGNLQESLKDSGHGASDSKKHDGLRSALIVSEIALACVLLVGAGLLLRSFLRILDVDLGFKPAGPRRSAWIITTVAVPPREAFSGRRFCAGCNLFRAWRPPASPTTCP